MNKSILNLTYCVSTHSRPKAAGSARAINITNVTVSTHSRPKAAADTPQSGDVVVWFQHTAARRRLISAETSPAVANGFNTQPPEGGCYIQALFDIINGVSTHSRPKAADRAHLARQRKVCFNTQPPEGG